MSNRTPLLPALLALLAAAPLSAGQINFVYPAEDASLPAVSRTFVFGNISPSTAALLINGSPVPVHTNGGFIAYLPVSGGDFVLTAALDDGTTAQRRLKVRQPDPVPSTGALRLEFTSNYSDSEVLPDNWLRISAAGTPGREAVFSLEGVFKDLPMEEAPPGSGRYYGSYLVKRGDGPGGELKARFKAGLFARGAAAAAKGRIRIISRPSLVETSTDTVVLKNAPDGGYMLFLPKGVKLVTGGRAGGYRQIWLADGETAWVDDAKVQPAAGAPYPAGYGSETGVIKLKKTDFGSCAAITLNDRLPYAAEIMPWGLRVTLYYANLHTNWVIYDSADALVKNVAFRQAGSGKVEIDFETGGEPWGYNVTYPNGGKSLQVDLRAKPKISQAWPRPLAGAVVVLDPGHSPFLKCENNARPPLKDYRYSALPALRCTLDGAVGPKETYEVNVNMALALRVQEKLSALGAQVKLTRNGDENVDLADRPKVAQALGGDLFISIHNNAIGDGEDPAAQPRGYSVYYYQRQSRALADALHRAYMRNIDLPDEGLRYGDYLVARMTWMPAALIENAYMILPRQEELLNTPAFQERLAAAMTEGVLDFFGVAPRASGARR